MFCKFNIFKQKYLKKLYATWNEIELYDICSPLKWLYVYLKVHRWRPPILANTRPRDYAAAQWFRVASVGGD